jgi:hypothetical protein
MMTDVFPTEPCIFREGLPAIVAYYRGRRRRLVNVLSWSHPLGPQSLAKAPT